MAQARLKNSSEKAKDIDRLKETQDSEHKAVAKFFSEASDWGGLYGRVGTMFYEMMESSHRKVCFARNTIEETHVSDGSSKTNWDITTCSHHYE